VGAQQSLELAAKEAEKFALEMVNYATPAVAAFADMLAKSTAKLNEILGTGASDEKGGGIMGSLEGGGYGAIGGAILGGLVGALGGPGGVVLGAKLGAVAGTGIGSYLGGRGGGGAAAGGGGGGGSGGGGGGGRAAAPATGGATTTQGLAAAGLKLRPSGGDIQKEGEEVSPKLISLAKQIQSAVPGFSYFSGFNDRYHQEESPESLHTKGMALDFVLSKKPSPKEGQQIASAIQGMGAGKVIDEYNKPSAKATGGHMHVSIPEFAKGGIASGPKSGYKAMLHGTEAVVPLPDGKKIPVNMQESSNGNMSKQIDMMGAQLMRLDEMVTLMRRQVGTGDKLLRVSQS
jgi:hypothetical protein